MNQETNIPIPDAQVYLSSIAGQHEIECNQLGGFATQMLELATYEVYSGKWGYAESLDTINPVETTTKHFFISHQYKDDFILNNSWLVGGQPESGQWERTIPYPFDTESLAPSTDVSGDLGNKCWLTQNEIPWPGFEDLNGSTTLTSPPMDLSDMLNPVMEFSYWLMTDSEQETGGLETYLLDHNTGDQVLIENFTIPDTTWRSFLFYPEMHLEDLSNVSIHFNATDGGNDNLYEMGIDAFIVRENLVSTEVMDDIEVSIYPNPFDGELMIQNHERFETYVISNLYGQILKKGRIEAGKINASELISGVYFIQLKGEHELSLTQKVVKH